MSDPPILRAALAPLLQTLMDGNVLAQPDDEPWADTIARLHSGHIVEVTEETWDYFLEVLPPKLQRGSWFAFAEGQEELTLFWVRQECFYARRLTWEQTFQLCDATGRPREYWY